MNKKYGSSFFLILLLCSLLLLMGLFQTYISAIVFALLIASVFNPMYLRLNKFLGNRENLASASMLVFILLVLIIPTVWFVGTLSNEAYDFYDRTRDSVSLAQIKETLNSDSIWVERARNLSEKAGIEFTPESIEKLAAGLGKQVGFFLYKQLSSVASNLFNFLIHFFMMMFTIFYLFRDGARLREYITRLLPVPEEQVAKVIKKFNEMGSSLIFGNGISGIVQGILGGIGFAVFGLGSPLLWGSVLAFMAFLPIIGASIVFFPATAILVFQGKMSVAITYLLYNMVYSSVIEYIIKPRLIGRGMELNALLVFIGIIGGIKLFGILGIIYGPFIITIFLTLAEIYRIEYKDQTG